MPFPREQVLDGTIRTFPDTVLATVHPTIQLFAWIILLSEPNFQDSQAITPHHGKI